RDPAAWDGDGSPWGPHLLLCRADSSVAVTVGSKHRRARKTDVASDPQVTDPERSGRDTPSHPSGASAPRDPVTTRGGDRGYGKGPARRNGAFDVDWRGGAQPTRTPNWNG